MKSELPSQQEYELCQEYQHQQQSASHQLRQISVLILWELKQGPSYYGQSTKQQNGD